MGATPFLFLTFAYLIPLDLGGLLGLFLPATPRHPDIAYIGLLPYIRL